MDTCTVSDALDALGYPGAISGIGPMWPCGRIAGRVATVKLGPAADAVGQPAVHLGARAISAAEPGDVIVVDNRAGEGYAAGWGGLLSLAARLKGVGGVVVYGACRDVDDVAEVGLPYYAHSATPRTARRRVVEVSTNAALDLENVHLEPGDLVLADRSGVVFVAVALAEEVLAKADELFSREAEMATALRAGTEVTDVLAGNYESMLEIHPQAKG
jgi:regulator of RNase E activity RraA